jgi:hypothetical protein
MEHTCTRFRILDSREVPKKIEAGLPNQHMLSHAPPAVFKAESRVRTRAGTVLLQC